MSALYNGETPLEEFGVKPIQEETRGLYRKILGPNYEQVTGDNFRGYQLEEESLPFAQKLNELVGAGMYSQRLKKYDVENENRWRLGESPYIYDAGKHQMVTVNYNGKKYYKLVDVFDTAKTVPDWMPVAKGINDYISYPEIPYVVSTPWRELPAGQE